MFTLQFKTKHAGPKYEQLYRHIRGGIVAGSFRAGERLPSKRALAAHLRVSLNTVEHAYGQLIAEGYVESAEKSGYFVLPVAPRPAPPAAPPAVAVPPPTRPAPPACRYDLKTNSVDTASFPFVTWSKLMRECLRADHASLLRELEPQGDRQLRDAIAAYLKAYRAIRAAPEQIVVGAGTSSLLGMLTELIPPARYAVENPCYPAIVRTLERRRVRFHALPVDAEGLSHAALRRSRASVCVLTPSNQFPLGTVMSITRRHQLLDWAQQRDDRYLIEDDYDSDYRYSLKPAPALYTLAPDSRVVYLDTFTRTLSPSLRIAYMVLPPGLLHIYRQRIALFPCTVSGFEQRTLWRFIQGGHYERHLHRMRTLYKKRRDLFLARLAPLGGSVAVAGVDAGLHLRIRSTTGLTEQDLIDRARAASIRVHGLSAFYHGPVEETHTVVAGYGGLDDAALARAAGRLCKVWAH